jgi:hypothetical protein
MLNERINRFQRFEILLYFGAMALSLTIAQRFAITEIKCATRLKKITLAKQYQESIKKHFFGLEPD